jgi:hypothetical protein
LIPDRDNFSRRVAHGPGDADQVTPSLFLQQRSRRAVDAPGR